MSVVKEPVGALAERLAPTDVQLQRVPVDIGGEDERFELLHVLTTLDCLDWGTRPPVRVPKEARHRSAARSRRGAR